MNKIRCKMALVVATAAVGFNCGAHELDNERTVGSPTVSAKQVELAKDLPQTTVIRISKTNPKDVQVAHLKERLKPGAKLTKAVFETVAMNAETRGIAFDSGNELDTTTSTSSWRFGYYGNNRAYAGYGDGSPRKYRRARRYVSPYAYSGYNSYRRPYRYDSYAPSYYNYSEYCHVKVVNGVCPPIEESAYYPTYRYNGYAYNYAPYYRYSDPYYDYAYCSWYN